MTSVDFRHFIVRLGKKDPKLFYVRKKVGNRSCPFNALLSGAKLNVAKANLESHFNILKLIKNHNENYSLADLQMKYRESPDSAVFWSPANRTN